MPEPGRVSREAFDRFERALVEQTRAREDAVDKRLDELHEFISHKATGIRQEFNLRLEMVEHKLHEIAAGNDGVPVLREKIKSLEKATAEAERRIDDLRMSGARFAGIVAATAPAAGAVAWLLDRLLSP